jgi:predicted transcriptional regulator
MARTFTIQIRSFDEALEGFGRTFKALQAAKRITRKSGVYFTSLEAARNLLTPRRLALLRAIRKEHPRSIYELAKIVGRNLKNVQTDLQLLEQYGLVTLAESRSRANRRIKVPKVPSNEISLKIAI